MSIDGTRQRCALGRRLAYLKDPSGQLTVEQVASPEMARRFVPSTMDVPGFGFTDAVYWVRVRLEYGGQGGPDHSRWLLEADYPLMDEITFFCVCPDGRMRILESGDARPFANRDIEYRNPVFRLDLEKGKPVTVFVRARTRGSMLFPLVLWSPSAFAQKAIHEQAGFGLYYGIMLVMVCYNLFLFLSVRDRNYLFYVLYILSITGLNGSINGLAFQYLWPASPWWANQSVLVFLGGMQFCMALFTRSFLKTAENTPRLDMVLRLFLFLGPLTVVMALAGEYGTVLRMANIAVVLEVPFVFATGIVRWRQRYRPARFFTLALSNFLFGGWIYALKVPGILPANFLTTYAIQIGSALEVTILAFALADRINIERREKLDAQRDALEARDQVVRELQRVDRLKDAFLANTSHELRTPLHGIVGLAESLLAGTGGKPSPAVAANLSMIAASGRRLANLVNDILDFSRLKDRDIDLNIRPVDLRALADTVLTAVRPLAAPKGLELQNRIPDALPPVAGDENRLQQIFFNLVGNAVKFTDRGMVAVSAEPQDAQVVVTVSDTGIGLPEDRAEAVFRSFEQAETSDARRYGGTGLGLAITRRLVELHGGTITAAAGPEQGAVFRFTLPLSREEVPVAPPAEDLRAIAAPRFEEAEVPIAAGDGSGVPDGILPNARIFAVDDDPVNLQVVANHLDLAGSRVTTFTGGEPALAKIAAGDRPELVLLDIMMPRMTGYEVCRRLRESFTAAELPVILLTAKNRVTDLVEGFAAGANDYLVKPFTREELVARVDTHLKIRESYRVLRENLSLRNELVQRRQTVRELKTTQRRLAMILDRVGEAVLAFNESGEIGFVNRRCAQLLGRAPESLLASPLADLFAKEDAARMLAFKDHDAYENREVSAPSAPDEFSVVFPGSDGAPVRADLQIVPLALDEERLFLVTVKAPVQVPGPDDGGTVSALKVATELNRNRERLRGLEETLADALAAIDQSDPVVFRELKSLDAALAGLGRSLSRREDPEGRRLLALAVMQQAITCWTGATGGTKFDLARQSGLWQVYTNADGWERAQTLDRYLDPAAFPKKPRWSKIVQTAAFVLSACEGPSPASEKLVEDLERLRAMG